MFLNAQKTPNTVTSRDLRMQRSGCYPKFCSPLEGLEGEGRTAPACASKPALAALGEGNVPKSAEDSKVIT